MDKEIKPSGVKMPDTKNRALLGAFRRGTRDAENGVHQNPYGDIRAVRGSVTFSRAFRRFWQRGHDSVACRVAGEDFHQGGGGPLK